MDTAHAVLGIAAYLLGIVYYTISLLKRNRP